jgi:pimeloyl-ACP methyl ester carboxylesterase
MEFKFTVIGEGEPILLVHGWGGSINSLENLQQKLATQYKVYNLELPGHGDLSSIEKIYTIDDYVNYVYEFIRSQNFQEIIYIGHSFGGHLGLRLTIKYPELFKDLILIDASGIKPNNSVKKMFWNYFAKVTKPIVKLPGGNIVRKVIYKGIIKEQDYIKTTGPLKETFRNIVRSYLKEEDLNEIKIPTLIIWGRNDTYTPLWMGRKLNILIKQSELVIMEGKHGLPISEPEKITVTIKNWIKNENIGK